MNEHLAQPTSAGPDRALSPSGYALLSRDDEVALAREVEEGERAMLRALLKAEASLHELAALGRDIEEGRLSPRDALRSTEHASLDREEASRRLVAALRLAGELARVKGGARVNLGARRRLADELEGLRLHRRVLDRAACALREAPRRDKPTRRAIEDVDAGRRLADSAKTRFVEANRGLVMLFAKRRFGQGLPLCDLMQEGNIGLMRAVDKFDHRRGIRFSTYASWWVRQQITRALLDQARIIRLPVHVAETRHKVRRAERAFEQAHGRAPSEAELGAETGLWAEKVRSAREIVLEPISLEAPAGADREARLGDFVPDRSTPAPDEEIARARMREQMKELVQRLSPREQDVLRRRFGLDDAPEETLAEIGASLSISRERVRQIEAEALRKLRAPSKIGELESYLAA